MQKSTFKSLFCKGLDGLSSVVLPVSLVVAGTFHGVDFRVIARPVGNNSSRRVGAIAS